VWGEVFPEATHGDSMSLLRVHPTRMSLSPTVVRRKVKVEQWLNIAAMSSWAMVAIGTEKRLEEADDVLVNSFRELEPKVRKTGECYPSLYMIVIPHY
jgi:hypothetical protein